ncbi:hypothetical protein J6S88_05540 [bacterium]|nr:hypothetical protein [bacterium]
MISSVSQSPSFEGKAVVNFNIKKRGLFLAQLDVVAKKFGKTIKFDKKVTETTVPRDMIVVQDVIQVNRRGNNVSAIIVSREDNSQLIANLSKVFDKDKVQTYEEFINKTRK